MARRCTALCPPGSGGATERRRSRRRCGQAWSQEVLYSSRTCRRCASLTMRRWPGHSARADQIQRPAYALALGATCRRVQRASPSSSRGAYFRSRRARTASAARRSESPPRIAGPSPARAATGRAPTDHGAGRAPRTYRRWTPRRAQPRRPGERDPWGRRRARSGRSWRGRAGAAGDAAWSSSRRRGNRNDTPSLPGHAAHRYPRVIARTFASTYISEATPSWEHHAPEHHDPKQCVGDDADRDGRGASRRRGRRATHGRAARSYRMCRRTRFALCRCPWCSEAKTGSREHGDTGGPLPYNRIPTVRWICPRILTIRWTVLTTGDASSGAPGTFSFSRYAGRYNPRDNPHSARIGAEEPRRDHLRSPRIPPERCGIDGIHG